MDRSLLVRALMLSLVVVAGSLAGCAADDANTNETGESDPSQNPNCDSRSGEGKQGATAAQMQCKDVSGAATQSQSFTCDTPSQSAVRVVTNMSAGSLTLTVNDADDATVFERTYEQTGRQNDSARINEGAAGEWLVEAERDDAFEGTYGVQVACAGSQ